MSSRASTDTIILIDARPHGPTAGAVTLLEILGLDPQAENVYRLMLAEPGWGIAELAGKLSIEERTVRIALDRLFELSLLRRSGEREGELRAVSPQVGLQSLLARQQADVDQRMQRIAAGQAAMAALVAEYAERPAADLPDSDQVLGFDAIQRRIEELSGSTRVELLSIMPGTQTEAAVEAAKQNNAEMLARNVIIRTTMQDAARNHPGTAAYAQTLTDAGAEVRTAPLLPPRMLIFDRALALVPIDPSDTRAGVLQLAGRGVVASLVTLYEQVWETAVPLGATVTRGRQGLHPQERELLKLLGQGHTDSSAASRLGVSERTCRRVMADLMERLGARSRFEAGLLAAREGWL